MPLSLCAGSCPTIARDPALVPGLWWYELRNVLIVNERRGRLNREKTAHTLRLVRALPAAIDTGTEEELLLATCPPIPPFRL
jgi:hypothetical protein